MILSRRQIEDMADTVIGDFSASFYNEDAGRERIMPRCTPIDQFASEYLGLDVSFERLSTDGSLCGLTAYGDTEFRCETEGGERIIKLKRNQVLLDSSFIDPGQVSKLCGKRRFTLAHECAHQILFQLESDETKAAFRKSYAELRNCSFRELKTREDWNEWQANALGAAILMPGWEIGLAMWRFAPGRKLRCYGGRFRLCDRDVLDTLAGIFGVSSSALVIRLRGLGHIEDLPYSEYIRPVEVFQ